MKKSFRIFGLALFCSALLACSQNEGTRIQSNNPTPPKPGPGPDDGNVDGKPRPTEANVTTLLTFSLAAIIEAENLIISLAELDFPDQKASCPSSDFNPNSPIIDAQGNLPVRLHWSQCQNLGAAGFEYALIQLDPELPPTEAIRLGQIKSAEIYTDESNFDLITTVSGQAKRFPLKQKLRLQFLEQKGSEKHYSMSFYQSMLLEKTVGNNSLENRWNTSLFGKVRLSASKISFEELIVKTDRTTIQQSRSKPIHTSEALSLESSPQNLIRSSDCGIPNEGEMKAIYSSDRFATLSGELALGTEGAKVSFSKAVTKLMGCSENSPNFIYNLSPALVNQL